MKPVSSTAISTTATSSTVATPQHAPKHHHYLIAPVDLMVGVGVFLAFLVIHSLKKGGMIMRSTLKRH